MYPAALQAGLGCRLEVSWRNHCWYFSTDYMQKDSPRPTFQLRETVTVKHNLLQICHALFFTSRSSNSHPFFALSFKFWIVRPKLIRCRATNSPPPLYNQLASTLHIGPLVPWRLVRLCETHYKYHHFQQGASKKVDLFLNHRVVYLAEWTL